MTWTSWTLPKRRKNQKKKSRINLLLSSDSSPTRTRGTKKMKVTILDWMAERMMLNGSWIWTPWMVIGLVSLYDNYLAVKYQHCLRQTEENPVARLILHAFDWQIEPFVAIKTLGTGLALYLLYLLHRQR